MRIIQTRHNIMNSFGTPYRVIGRDIQSIKYSVAIRHLKCSTEFNQSRMKFKSVCYNYSGLTLCLPLYPCSSYSNTVKLIITSLMFALLRSTHVYVRTSNKYIVNKSSRETRPVTNYNIIQLSVPIQPHQRVLKNFKVSIHLYLYSTRQNYCPLK